MKDINPTTCPKCSYVRKESDNAPLSECPNCGIYYEKYEAMVAARSASDAAATNEPSEYISTVPDTLSPYPEVRSSPRKKLAMGRNKKVFASVVGLLILVAVYIGAVNYFDPAKQQIKVILPRLKDSSSEVRSDAAKELSKIAMENPAEQKRLVDALLFHARTETSWPVVSNNILYPLKGLLKGNREWTESFLDLYLYLANKGDYVTSETSYKYLFELVEENIVSPSHPRFPEIELLMNRGLDSKDRDIRHVSVKFSDWRTDTTGKQSSSTSTTNKIERWLPRLKDSSSEVRSDAAKELSKIAMENPAEQKRLVDALLFHARTETSWPVVSNNILYPLKGLLKGNREWTESFLDLYLYLANKGDHVTSETSYKYLFELVEENIVSPSHPRFPEIELLMNRGLDSKDEDIRHVSVKFSDWLTDPKSLAKVGRGRRP